MTASFVDVRNLRRVFDVSKPWLNRVLEGGHLEFLKAVDGVTFDIKKGETFALVGESGSGKTTVARMVVGLLPPSSGEVIIDGVSMTNARQAQARQRLRRRNQVAATRSLRRSRRHRRSRPRRHCTCRVTSTAPTCSSIASMSATRRSTRARLRRGVTR